MKKYMPLILLAIVIIVGAGYILTKTNIKSTPYSATNPGRYTSSPSPSNQNLKTYTNSQYNFVISYPTRGLNAMNQTIECGNFIQNKNTSLFPPANTVVLDNIALIKVSPWTRSISDYIASQGATNLYSEKTILNSGADEAVSLNGLKKSWSGEGPAPLGYDQDIYKKNGMLFESLLQQNFMDNGCIPPADINGNPAGVDKTWRLEDNLKFN